MTQTSETGGPSLPQADILPPPLLLITLSSALDSNCYSYQLYFVKSLIPCVFCTFPTPITSKTNALGTVC